jgi:hypothetical protein
MDCTTDPVHRPIETDSPATYLIRVRGELEPEWSDRLGGMRIRITYGGVRPTTELRGTLADQTALAGVLTTLYQLGLPIISVERVNQG